MARDYAKFSHRFWIGETGRKIRSNRSAQVLAAYLITAPGSTMTGIYYLPLPVIAHETGMADGEVSSALAFLTSIDFAHYDARTEMVWIPSMAAWQIDDALRPGDKRVIGVRRELEALRGHPFVFAFWDRYRVAFCLGEPPTRRAIEAPSNPLRSQEHEQEQDQSLSLSGSGPVLSASGPDPEARAIPVPGVDGGLPRAIPALPAKPHDGPKLQVWLTDAWAAARFNGFGGTGFGAGGVPADKVRDTAERLAVAPETIPHVYASMLKFWRDVKAGRHGESHLCATRPAFAWPAWSGAFSGDFEAAIGAAPQIPARAATGPPSPSKWGHARAEDQKHTKSGEVEV